MPAWKKRWPWEKSLKGDGRSPYEKRETAGKEENGMKQKKKNGKEWCV